MKNSDDMVRLKKLLFNDRFSISKSAFEILKSDITCLLSSYFELSDDTIKLTVEPDADGNLTVAFSVTATQIKDVKIID